jgi:predicted metal-dependent HD superfamily phosphohydrolase
LRELDSYAADNPSVDPALLLQAEFALWYHDIVYIPGYSDNEQKSAEILIMHGEALGVPFKVTCACAQAIIATRHKYPYPLSEALPKIVADIDLAILGADPEKYDSYKVGIRKEYESTPIDIYAKVRADLLEKEFLSRKEIYQTEYFRSKYEKQARQNMAREISDLRESIC